jgi:hypothetical protein
MSSRKAPFATLHDKTSYEPRREGTSAAAPWMKDQVSPNIGRATTIGSSYIASNSQTAPYATFHNQPLRRQVTQTTNSDPKTFKLLHAWRALCTAMFKVSSSFLRFGRLCAQNLRKDLTWDFLRGRVYAGIVAECPKLGKHLWRALCEAMFKVSSSFLRSGSCAQNLTRDLKWIFWEVGFLRGSWRTIQD